MKPFFESFTNEIRKLAEYWLITGTLKKIKSRNVSEKYNKLNVQLFSRNVCLKNQKPPGRSDLVLFCSTIISNASE